MLSPKLKIYFFKRCIHSFHFFGIIGFTTGSLLGVLLCIYLNLKVEIILLMTLTGAATFFLLAFLAKLITGEEKIVYYHHEIAILIACSIVLKTLGLPVLNYLDIVLLGIATFLAFGRIGCFSVGCCHGKPFKKGIIYSHEHVKAGFTPYYEGVPLMPVQMIESAFVFIIIIIGLFILLSHFPPGTFLILYTVVYGAFRFIIEFFRGDAERPYFKGLSEAQWTTLLLITVSSALTFRGLIPLYNWHIAILVLIIISSFIIVSKKNIKNEITNARHIKQIAMALNETDIKVSINKELINAQLPIHVFKTDLELNLSKGQFKFQGHLFKHYTVSCHHKIKLSYPIIKKLATVIQQLQKHTNSFEIYERQNNVYHILFRE